MRRKTMAGVLVAIWLSVLGTPAQAYTEGRLSFPAMVERASAIVVGTVEDTEGTERFFGEHLRVVTETLVADLVAIKGDVPDMELSVIQFGGQVDDVVEWYPGMPFMEPGKRYLMFLIEGNGGLLFPIGAQGLFTVIADPDRGIDVLASSNGRTVTGVQDGRVKYGAPAFGVSGDSTTALSTAMPLERFLEELQAELN